MTCLITVGAGLLQIVFGLSRIAQAALASYPGVLRDYNPPFTAERHDALERGQLRLARFDARGRIVSAE